MYNGLKGKSLKQKTKNNVACIEYLYCKVK